MQLLDYKALPICTYNLANKCDIYLWDSNYWCCYYGNKVIHNTCNMAIRDLPDMYTLSPRACGPRALGIHIRQILHGHFITITYIPMCGRIKEGNWVITKTSPSDNSCSNSSKLIANYCQLLPIIAD